MNKNLEKKPSKKLPIIIGAMALILIGVALIQISNDDKKELTPDERLESHPLQPKLSTVKIVPPKPLSIDFIRAVPELSQGNTKNVDFEYQWYVNDEPVDTYKKLLERKHYKKGDTIYCTVRAKRGKFKVKEMESEKVTVGNSPPKISIPEVKDFEIPCEIHLQPQASDPDGDKITYKLISPLDKDIVVNPDSGEIRWFINYTYDQFELQERGITPSPEDEGRVTTPQPKKNEQENLLPGSVRVVIEARDSDGAASTASVIINIRRGKERKE